MQTADSNDLNRARACNPMELLFLALNDFDEFKREVLSDELETSRSLHERG